MRRSFIVLTLIALGLAAAFAVPGLVPARAQVGASTGTSTPTPTATYAAPTVPPASTATAVSVTTVGTTTATPVGTSTAIPTATPCTGTACVPTSAGAVVQKFTVRREGKNALLRWVLGVKVSLKGFRVFAGTHQVTRHLIRPHTGLAYHLRTAWTGRRQYVLHVLFRNGSVGIAFSK